MSLAIFSRPKHAPILRAFFVAAKNAVLGNRYELSVAFVSPRDMRRLNKRYRNKDASADILSFPLAPRSGEIICSLADVATQARQFGRTPSNFLQFLFIHGLLHLKGYRHGSRMEREEEKFRKKFSI